MAKKTTCRDHCLMQIHANNMASDLKNVLDPQNCCGPVTGGDACINGGGMRGHRPWRFVTASRNTNCCPSSIVGTAALQTGPAWPEQTSTMHLEKTTKHKQLDCTPARLLMKHIMKLSMCITIQSGPSNAFCNAFTSGSQRTALAGASLAWYQETEIRIEGNDGAQILCQVALLRIHVWNVDWHRQPITHLQLGGGLANTAVCHQQ